MLTQMLKQVSPGVEDPSYTRECQDPCFRPLFLCCVARVVDENVSTSGFDLFLVGRGGGLSYTVQQMKENLRSNEVCLLATIEF